MADRVEGVSDDRAPLLVFSAANQRRSLRLFVVRGGRRSGRTEVARLSLQQRFVRDPLFSNEGFE
jgi:hypothetical protein